MVFVDGMSLSRVLHASHALDVCCCVAECGCYLCTCPGHQIQARYLVLRHLPLLSCDVPDGCVCVFYFSLPVDIPASFTGIEELMVFLKKHRATLSARKELALKNGQKGQSTLAEVQWIDWVLSCVKYPASI
jgi:hypothetical protein